VTENPKPLRFATVTDQGTQWRLKRNCALTPRQVGGCFVGLCALSLAVGLFFWSQGAVLVLPFTALELLAAGAAFRSRRHHPSQGE